MILKLLLIIGIIAVIYFFFIKPKPLKKPKQAAETEKNDSDEMVKCAKCDTYCAVDDAFIKEGRYYCSKECLNS